MICFLTPALPLLLPGALFLAFGASAYQPTSLPASLPTYLPPTYLSKGWEAVVRAPGKVAGSPETRLKKSLGPVIILHYIISHYIISYYIVIFHYASSF